MRNFLRYFSSSADSSSLRKKTILRPAIGLLFFASIIFYLLDQKFGHFMPNWVYQVKVSACLISLLLTFFSIELAIAFFLVTFNFVFFLIMQSEPYKTGFNFHMFSFGFLAMNLYGYRRRWIGIGFAILSALLALASHIGMPPILKFRNYSADEIQIYYFTNSLIFLITTPTLLFFALGWNFEAEKKLVQQKELADLQNEQMLKTNEELDQFVYKTSHDLRAPLNEILAMADKAEKVEGDRQHFFDRMKGQVVLMDEYIREIIDYSRNSRIEVRAILLHLPTLVEEVCASLDAIPGYNTIDFSIDIKEQYVVSDPDRLKTIIRNLVFNAIKYRDLSKAKSTINISAGKSQSEYWIKVKDNGIGIELAHQQKIFEMFYKGIEESVGSGLGLYMVKETVTKLGGCVSLQSSLGQGSEFIVTLPQNQNANK